ncbi:hypothetical protein [Corynebacterium crudilactis]|uniref:SMP-30/Gluconolactonase/LRE-like region domain-containing protein n=1 Tax=Corynebacterium crudilactis TaxID=1652495 RepID=A0A172QT80_9CORY|nr:hypothetical protein [Corynebacterium crudilactis]ANE03870.1 hypothetical protein ccrud_06360 [Corynebacterium crudilactis]
MRFNGLIIPAAAALTAVFTLAACTPSEAESTADAEASTSSATEATETSVEQVSWTETLLDGPTKPEDLVLLESGVVFLSGMSENPGDDDGGAGSLHAVNTDSGGLTNVWTAENITEAHDTETFGTCDGPLDASVAAPHGLGTEVSEDGTEYLYVVNHGGRESIEVFTVDGEALTWVGCAVLPAASMGNGVVPDPDSDGFYVTNFLDPTNMEASFEKAFAGENTGEILHWTPAEGWSVVEGSEMSTPNGIAISKDGGSIYVASWGGRELVELDRSSGERLNTVALEIMPDNLRYTEDGKLLVTGQVIDSFETFVGYEFGDLEPEDRYDVFALAPEAFTVETVAAGKVAGFGNPTTALEVGDKIFVGSVAGDKILQLERA